LTRGVQTAYSYVSPAEGVRVVCHEGIDAVRRATPAWCHVFARAKGTSVFSRPEWAAAWSKVFGAHHRALILEFSIDDNPIAVAPLQLTRYPTPYTRRIEFLGGSASTPLPWLINPYHFGSAFYNDIVCVPGCEEPALSALGAWLERNLARWDDIRLTCVPASSPLATNFERLSTRWRPEVQHQVKAYVDTSQGWEAYRQRLGRRQRRHIRYEPHALERVAGGELRLVKRSGDEAHAAMEDFISLHETRWRARGRAALPVGEATFYRQLAQEPSLGIVYFHLMAADRTLAMQFGFDDGSRYVPYGFAFDPHLERSSPAQVLIQYVIRHCCEDGHAEVDLAALKAVDQWAGQARERVHLAARSPRAASRLCGMGLDAISAGLLAAQDAAVVRRARAAAGHYFLRGTPPPTLDVPEPRILKTSASASARRDVTVVVPTRNSSRTLEACLRSIRDQTCPCTLIVVDNHSSDRTQEIAREYADVVAEVGPERCTQRNVGARLTDTEFVGFIDSDMVLEPQVVQEAAERLSAGAGAVMVSERSIGTGFWARVRQFEKSFYVGDMAVEAARFFRREVFERAGGWDESFIGGEDWDLHLRTAAVAPIARIEAEIAHDEGRLTLREDCAKKARYAHGLVIFARKHGRNRLASTLAGRSYLSKPWRLVIPHPLLGAGLIILKVAEASAVLGALVRLRLQRSQLR